MSTETPIYADLMAERYQAGDWTPDQLRAPLDLDEWIADSYQRAMVRSHLRYQIARRAKIRKSHQRRMTPLP